MRKLIFLGAIALFALAACQQQSTPSNGILGTLELTVGGESGLGQAVLRPLASTPLADSAITVGSVTNVYGSDANFRYVTAQFNITANQAFNNLTLYAYNRSGTLGGTAIRNLVNFTGGAVAGTAQSLLPINARNASGNIVTTNADFQAFSSVEASNLQADAVSAGIITNSEEVLGYGFVARKNATTRAFASGETGSITVAYKIPIGSQATNTYRFSANFVVANETVSRVTRDADESTASVNSRAAAFSPAVSETALLGADSDNATTGTTVRLRNSKIGAQSTYLFNTSANNLAISEVLRNPPGADSSKEYFELRGTVSASIPTNTYLIMIEGDTTPANPGQIDVALDLGNATLGSNGFRFLGENGFPYTVNLNATSSNTGWTNALQNASNSFLLVAAASAPTVNTDVDSNDDCILDGVATSWIILDSIGMFDASATLDCVYTKFAFKPTASGGAAPRASRVVDTGTMLIDYVARRADSANHDITSTAWRGVLLNNTVTSPPWTFTTSVPSGDVSQSTNHIGSSNP
jgi:hypothetical protein